jgi:hypothetical protein
MKFKLLLAMMVLNITNSLLFAVPGGGHIKMTPVGQHLYKNVKKTTVSWDFQDKQIIGGNSDHIHEWNVESGTFVITNTVPNAKAKGTLVGSFSKSINQIDISFDGPGSFKVEVTIKYKLKDLEGQELTDQLAQEPNWGVCTATFNIILDAELKDVILETSPSWAPQGKSVKSLKFEIEIGDSITLKAVTDPISPDVGQTINWSGAGVSGTGYTKTVKYDTHGAKNITVWIGSSTIDIQFYVNNNASLPPIVTVNTDKEWAHCGNESIKLTAKGTDRDFVNGAIDKNTNRIDLDATEWILSLDFGTLDSLTGAKVVWTPSADTKPSQETITALIHDQIESYSPRDENYKEVPVKIGAFKVKILTIVTSSNGITKQWAIDEDGVNEGFPNQTTTGSAFAFATTDLYIPGDPAVIKEDSFKVLTEWKFLTNPEQAIPSGSIKGELTIGGRAKFIGKVSDFDLLDDPVNFAIGASVGNVYSVGAEVSITVNETDDDEGTAICAVQFSTDGGGFSESMPDSDANKLVVLSETYDDFWGDGNKLWNEESKVWSKERETVPHLKKKGDTVNAIFIFNAYGRAINDDILAENDTIGEASIKNIRVFSSCKSVKYIK